MYKNMDFTGNQFLHHFSTRTTYELLVELNQKPENCSLYALYSSFSIGTPDSKFTLSIGPYISGAGGNMYININY